jgi:hypothetical protein
LLLYSLYILSTHFLWWYGDIVLLGWSAYDCCGYHVWRDIIFCSDYSIHISMWFPL